MSMNTAPNAERVHIGIFGKRNAGKSSLINAMTGQDLAIVSDIAGTTTDPVSKAMELLPLGPVVMIDTPGLDDVGELGTQRIRKAMQVMNKCDLAVVVVDASEGITDTHQDLLSRLEAKNIPHIIAMNKCDLLDAVPADTKTQRYVSAATGAGIYALKEAIAHLVPTGDNGRRIIADLLQPNDFVVLVVPIDSAAPKGRLILPQQQTIRDILEAGANAIVCRDTESNAEKARTAAAHGGHGQSSIQACLCGYTEGRTTHFFFHSVCAIQGTLGQCRARRHCTGPVKRRRYRFNCRGMYPSPAMR